MKKLFAAVLVLSTLACAPGATARAHPEPQQECMPSSRVMRFEVIYRAPQTQIAAFRSLLSAELFMARLRAQGWNSIHWEWHYAHGHIHVYYSMTGWWGYHTYLDHHEAMAARDAIIARGFEATINVRR